MIVQTGHLACMADSSSVSHAAGVPKGYEEQMGQVALSAALRWRISLSQASWRNTRFLISRIGFDIFCGPLYVCGACVHPSRRGCRLVLESVLQFSHSCYSISGDVPKFALCLDS